MKKISYLIGFGLLALWLGVAVCKNQRQVMLSGGTMGTSYHITYLAPFFSGLNQETVEQKVKAVLSQVNAQMSSYDKNSALSKLNQNQQPDKPVEIPQSLAFVLEEAVRLNAVTQGGLDITIGPLVNLWGFGAKDSREGVGIVPEASAIAAAMSQTGIDKMAVSQVEGRYVFQKKIPDLYLDLASIAKGFGVDEVADLLDSLEIKNFLVEIGGEIRTRGKNKQGNLWRVGIEKPDTKGERAVELVVPLTDQGMATSGDYRNYFEKSGKRFAHVIDPVTGYPIEHSLASITVVHERCMTADGLATGLYVLGPEKALQIAEKENLAVYLIVRTEDGFQGIASSAFVRLLK